LRDIPGYGGRYAISGLGHVYSRNYNGTGQLREMKPTNCKGYRRVCLQDGAEKKHRFVHRLMLEAFVGPSALQVNHKNGKKHDNRLMNLEYVTASENRAHSFRIGNESMKGENHTRHRLTNNNVMDIRGRLMRGERQADIAADYDIDKSAISRINTGARWSHIASSEKVG
jgi:hypothetical protein